MIEGAIDSELQRNKTPMSFRLLKRDYVMRILAVVILIISFVGILWSPPTFAGFEKVETKFNRGMCNLLGFWIEIPYQIVEGIKGNALTGLPIGFGKSLYMMPLRAGSGAVDLLTFPVPFPIGEYGSLAQPGYNPWIEKD